MERPVQVRLQFDCDPIDTFWIVPQVESGNDRPGCRCREDRDALDEGEGSPRFGYQPSNASLSPVMSPPSPSSTGEAGTGAILAAHQRKSWIVCHISPREFAPEPDVVTGGNRRQSRPWGDLLGPPVRPRAAAVSAGLDVHLDGLDGSIPSVARPWKQCSDNSHTRV